MYCMLQCLQEQAWKHWIDIKGKIFLHRMLEIVRVVKIWQRKCILFFIASPFPSLLPVFLGCVWQIWNGAGTLFMGAEVFLRSSFAIWGWLFSPWVERYSCSCIHIFIKKKLDTAINVGWALNVYSIGKFLSSLSDYLIAVGWMWALAKTYWNPSSQERCCTGHTCF